MKKSLIITLILVVMCLLTTSVWAKSSKYVYRKRAEWVKLVKLSNKQMAGQTLAHPNEAVTIEQMTDMLASLQMNKAQVFKKGFKTSEIFTMEEAQKYAPMIVKALKQAQPNQVVNVSVIHKRPYFVVRSDFLSLINVYAKDDGVHFYFSKLFAKLEGDYEQASRIYESIRKAKSLRVSLMTSSGQIISGDGKEIVMNPTYDYSSNVAVAQANADKKKKKNKKNKKAQTQENTSQKLAQTELQPEATAPPQADVKTRLEKLEELQKTGLITDEEYKNKREEILKEM